MHAYITDNEHLADVQRALLSGDEQFARDKIESAAAYPHLIPWLRRLLKEIGKELRPALAKLLQDVIAEWEVTSMETGAKGGETPPPEESPTAPPQRRITRAAE